MRYHQWLVAALLLIGTLASTSSAAGSFTTIDVPGADGTSATGINELGQIVGAYFDPINKKNRGFLLDDGNLPASISRAPRPPRPLASMRAGRSLEVIRLSLPRTLV
jgi:probable HAF family extracellular repeat protein